VSLPALFLATQAADVCEWPDEDDEFAWGLDLCDPDLNPTLDIKWVLYPSEGAGDVLAVRSVGHDLGPMA